MKLLGNQARQPIAMISSNRRAGVSFYRHKGCSPDMYAHYYMLDVTGFKHPDGWL